MPFMASPGSQESSEPQSEERRSVLAELPHTRPQRASPRRETARRRARAAGSPGPGEPSRAAAADTKPAGDRSGAAKVSGAAKTAGSAKTARTAKTAGPATTAGSKTSGAAGSKKPDAGARRPAVAGSRRSGATEAKPSDAAAAKPSDAAPTKRSPAAKAKRRGGKPDREPTPRQGYEADNELTGTPVSPPSGPEMLGALAELAGELAQTGVAAGSRLLRGALSRLSSS